MKLLALMVCACCVPAAGQAQTAPVVPISAQPLQHVRDGRIQGCGVRLTGGQPGAEVSAWFDVSFNLFRRGLGLAQSIAYEIRRSEDGEGRPAKVPVHSTWLKASEGSTRRGESAERSESLIYTLLTDDVLALFEALAKEQPLTLGIRRWGEGVDSVYTARARLNADSRQQISACLAGLALE